MHMRNQNGNVFLHMHYHQSMEPKPPRPPSDRGQGRKPASASGELMKNRILRMTDAEWEKCKQLGGAAWVREQINKAGYRRGPMSGSAKQPI